MEIKTKQIGLRLDERIIEEFEKMGKQKGLTKQKLITYVLANYIQLNLEGGIQNENKQI